MSGALRLFVIAGEPSEYLGAYDNTLDQRAADLTDLDDELIPDIDSDTYEFVYSRFQSVVVQFRETRLTYDTRTVGETRQFNTNVRYLPYIADMQEYVSQRSVRNAAGDALVKAPIPCFLQLAFNVEIAPGETAPVADDIADALADVVNNYGFSGRLPASRLCDVVHNFLTGLSSVTAIDMFGRIRYPDGTYHGIRSSELLEIPDAPTSMVTGRTTMFYLDPADVALSIVEADIPTV